MTDIRPTVLVVEDEQELRDELLELLAMRGFQVLEAADVDIALYILARAPGPITLLSDLRLAGGSGLDLIRRISADPALGAKVVRKLLMTGHTDLTEQVEVELARLDVVMLFKPVRTAELLALLNAATAAGAH